MSIYDYDLFVMGAGSGGVRASRFAASYGARVAVAEERYLGGTCVNVGCVPKKLLVIAAQFREQFEDAAGFGWDVGERSINWPSLIAAKDQEIQRLNGIYARLLDNAGVTRYQGHATLEDAHTIKVGDKIVTARYVLIATGGWPTMPAIPGIEHAVTSNEAFHFSQLDKHILIVGAGYIGVEFAGIFNGLGAETTLLCRGDQILRGFDEDIRTTLAQELAKKGVTLRKGLNVSRIDKTARGLQATLTDDTVILADKIMFATGRTPLSAGIGLEQAGVALDAQGAVLVDPFSRTSVENIYAVGDVTNRVNLTPVALAEGMALAKTLFADQPTKPDYRYIPTAIFSQPPAATVGYTEAQARAEFGDVDIYKTSFRPMQHTLSGRDEQTMMKLVVDPVSDRVVGLHMVGPQAGEIVQGFAVALKAGATKAVFDSTVGIHPTAAEEFVTMRTKYVGD
ncbi:MAG: glutathione-disulfide reductase [Caldilineaceae bacterium]|nr:glutathione-disulfide reductase [Caldilineaceae bacterium]